MLIAGLTNLSNKLTPKPTEEEIESRIIGADIQNYVLHTFNDIMWKPGVEVQTSNDDLMQIEDEFHALYDELITYMRQPLSTSYQIEKDGNKLSGTFEFEFTAEGYVLFIKPNGEYRRKLNQADGLEFLADYLESINT